MFRNAFLRLLAIFLLADFIICEYNLTIVHLTDFHSHWFEFNENEKKCTTEESEAGKCFGGFPRLLSLVKDIRSKDQNVVVLSSGEFFLGRSLNALHGWKLANAFLPYLDIDAMSLANHDFSSGMFELSAFLYGMKFPVLCANMWARKTSFMNSRVNKSAVLNIGGEKIGIVGYLHPESLEKSRQAASVKFFAEIPAIEKEVRRLEDEGVNKIIALGHSGYNVDLDISKNVKGIDVVIGGNSDIILDDRVGASTVGNIHGNYPRVHHHENEIDAGETAKNKTLVLHIPQHGKYVGKLKITFDDNGKVIQENGEVILLDNKIKQDEHILELLISASNSLEKIAEHALLPDDQEILAYATATFEAKGCRIQECTLGNLITDAILQAYKDLEKEASGDRWKNVDAVIFNAGAIRYPLVAGPITIKDLIHSLFVGDFMSRVRLSGAQLRQLFEHSVKRYDAHGVDNPGSFLQIAGLRVTYALDRKPGNRVFTLLIQRNGSFELVEANRSYIVGMPDFISNGGDGYQTLEDKNPKDWGKLEVLLLIDYLRGMGRVTPNLDGRINLLGNEIKFMRGLAVDNLAQSDLKRRIENNYIKEEIDVLNGLSYIENESLANSQNRNARKISAFTTMNTAMRTSPDTRPHLQTFAGNATLNDSQLLDNSKVNSTELKNDNEWSSTDSSFRTSSETVVESINSTIKVLVETMIPSIDASTLQTLIDKAHLWNKEKNLINTLKKKITVTSLNPSEVTTLASKIIVHDKDLDSFFSSLMKEHETKIELLYPHTYPSTIQNATASTKENEEKILESNGSNTLNISEGTTKRSVDVHDKDLDSFFSSLMKEHETKIEFMYPHSYPSTIQNATASTKENEEKSLESNGNNTLNISEGTTKRSVDDTGTPNVQEHLEMMELTKLLSNHPVNRGNVQKEDKLSTSNLFKSSSPSPNMKMLSNAVNKSEQLSTNFNTSTMTDDNNE